MVIKSLLLLLVAIPLAIYAQERPLSTLMPISPWAFFSMHDGLVYGSTVTEIKDSTGRLSPLKSESSTPEQWDTREAWWTGDGNASCFRDRLSSDPGFQRVFELNSGAVFIWFQIIVDPQSVSNVEILQVGFNPDWRILFDSAAKRFRVDFLVSDKEEFYGPGTATLADSRKYNVAILIDNRNIYKEVIFYWDGTQKHLTSIQNISTAVPWGDDGWQKLSIGCGTRGYFKGSLRRLGIINFGQNVPHNLDEIIFRLNEYNSIPWWGLDGV